MSHFPGGRLEDLIWDTWGAYEGNILNSSIENPFILKNIKRGLFNKLVRFYEEHRVVLESRLASYDEDMSWHDYKYMVVWDGIPSSPEEIFNEDYTKDERLFEDDV